MTRLISPAPKGLEGIPFGYMQKPYAPWNTHRGDDWKWRVLNPIASRKVVASAAGKVVSVYGGGGYNEGYGNRVVIEHPSVDGREIRTTYNHLASGSIKVKEGQTVQAGQHLGTMGATGEVNGVHLHRELTINGVRVDARQYHNKDIPGTPLEGAPFTVRGDIKSLLGRREATTRSQTSGNPLPSGKTYRFYYWKHGQKVTVKGGTGKKRKSVTSDVWVQGTSGRWFAAAGLTSQSTKGLVKKK